MGNLTEFQSKSIYNILYNKADFAIIISISNTRGIAAFLTKYMYNNYIYIYYIYGI